MPGNGGLWVADTSNALWADGSAGLMGNATNPAIDWHHIANFNDGGHIWNPLDVWAFSAGTETGRNWWLRDDTTGEQFPLSQTDVLGGSTPLHAEPPLHPSFSLQIFGGAKAICFPGMASSYPTMRAALTDGGGGGGGGEGGGDPADDPDGDWDHDGLTNQEEMDLGSDPENPQSDDDGVADGADAMPADSEISFSPFRRRALGPQRHSGRADSRHSFQRQVRGIV